MPINSNQKGKRGEREVRDLLIKFGYTARRGQQFSGGEVSEMTEKELQRNERIQLISVFGGLFLLALLIHALHG